MGTEKAAGVSDLGNRNEGVKTYSREENGGQNEKCGGRRERGLPRKEWNAHFKQ